MSFARGAAANAGLTVNVVDAVLVGAMIADDCPTTVVLIVLPWAVIVTARPTSVAGKLPEFLRDAGLKRVSVLDRVRTPLGTIEIVSGIRPTK